MSWVINLHRSVNLIFYGLAHWGRVIYVTWWAFEFKHSHHSGSSLGKIVKARNRAQLESERRRDEITRKEGSYRWNWKLELSYLIGSGRANRQRSGEELPAQGWEFVSEKQISTWVSQVLHAYHNKQQSSYHHQ